MTRPDWHDLAACKGQTELFFSLRRSERQQAIAICDTCPVLADCRQAAIDGEEWGAVWAGVDLLEAKSVAAALRRLGAGRARSCAVCGITYHLPAAVRGRIPLTCGPDCHAIYVRRQAADRKARNRLGRACPICGEAAPVGRLYCDDTCQATSRRRNRVRPMVDA